MLFCAWYWGARMRKAPVVLVTRVGVPQPENIPQREAKGLQLLSFPLASSFPSSSEYLQSPSIVASMD